MFEFIKCLLGDANVQSKRRQECQRGTQEYVRHNDFNSLRIHIKNYMTLGVGAYATPASRHWVPA